MNRDKVSKIANKAISGDKKAYAELCEEIIRDVLYICVKITGDLHMGEDAAQEALIQLGKSINKLKHTEQFPAWLNRCITNSCLNYMAKERRLAMRYTERQADEPMETNNEFLPMEWSEYKESRQIVLDCIQQLSTKQQHVLLMFYFEDMTLQEIAESTGINESTVRSNLRHARNSLKKQIEKAAGTKLTIMPAVAAVPAITLILRHDAASLVTEESTKKVLLAVSTAIAGGASTVAGMQIATLVASMAPAAAAIIIAAAVSLVSSPSPSKPSEDATEITPQYSSSISVQEEGEGDLYSSEPSSLAQVSQQAESNNASEPYPATEQPASPTFFNASGQVALSDGRGEILEHPALNLSGICVQAYQGDALVAESYTGADGSYILSLPDDSLAYTLRIAHNAMPEIGRQSGSVVLQPGVSEAPILYIVDGEAPQCVVCFFDDEQQLQATVDPATIELVVYDATPCEVQWEITPLGETASAYSGSEIRIDVAGLGLAPGRYTLTVTVTDFCGNESIIQKQFSIR